MIGSLLRFLFPPKKTYPTVPAAIHHYGRPLVVAEERQSA